MSHFVAGTGPAEGLAPLYARASAGTVMTNAASPLYTEPKPVGLIAKNYLNAMRYINWKQKIVNLTTLSSLVGPYVVIITTYGDTSDDKVVKNWRNFDFDD